MNINKNVPTIIKINLKSHYPCNKLYARKIWEHLFRLEHVENWKTLDNFLIDYELFANEIEKAYSSGTNIFYWLFYDKTGWTKIVHEEYLIENPCYKIEVDLNGQEISLTRLNEE